MTEHNHRHNDDDSLPKFFILAGMGVYFAYNLLSGNLTNYINSRFTWLSQLAVVLFLALAFMTLLNWFRERKHDHHDHDAHHHHHDHTHQNSWWMLLIVSLPLLFGILIPSQPLGAEAISGDIQLNSASVTTTTNLNIDPLDRNILDWLRQFYYTSDLNSFNGQEARVIGFVYREPDTPDNHFMVARFTVSCCVADASAIALPVNANAIDIDEIADGEWVQVEGSFQVGEFIDETVPILQLSNMTIVEQPLFPYINP